MSSDGASKHRDPEGGNSGRGGRGGRGRGRGGWDKRPKEQRAEAEGSAAADDAANDDRRGNSNQQGRGGKNWSQKPQEAADEGPQNTSASASASSGCPTKQGGGAKGGATSQKPAGTATDGGRSRQKIIFRNIPYFIDEADFVDGIGEDTMRSVNYLWFTPGKAPNKVKGRPPVSARAVLNVTKVSLVQSIHKRFDGVVWTHRRPKPAEDDADGKEGAAEVSSPVETTPANRPSVDLGSKKAERERQAILAAVNVPVSVEFCPLQAIGSRADGTEGGSSKRGGSAKDRKVGTIEADADYRSFCAALEEKEKVSIDGMGDGGKALDEWLESRKKNATGLGQVTPAIKEVTRYWYDNVPWPYGGVSKKEKKNKHKGEMFSTPNKAGWRVVSDGKQSKKSSSASSRDSWKADKTREKTKKDKKEKKKDQAKCGDTSKKDKKEKKEKKKKEEKSKGNLVPPQGEKPPPPAYSSKPSKKERERDVARANEGFKKGVASGSAASPVDTGARSSGGAGSSFTVTHTRRPVGAKSVPSPVDEPAPRPKILIRRPPPSCDS